RERQAAEARAQAEAEARAQQEAAERERQAAEARAQAEAEARAQQEAAERERQAAAAPAPAEAEAETEARVPSAPSPTERAAHDPDAGPTSVEALPEAVFASGSWCDPGTAMPEPAAGPEAWVAYQDLVHAAGVGGGVRWHAARSSSGGLSALLLPDEDRCLRRDYRRRVLERSR
ncbi:MAG: hypothetical protein ACOCVS_00460, partial [Planctomycetota bacterium]